MEEPEKYDAISFVDSLDTGKHVVLFYERFEYGLMLQLQFIKNGLLKGEHCVYGTHGDPTYIENQQALGELMLKTLEEKTCCTFTAFQTPWMIQKGP
ncbi:MAG: hypothetical protein HMLIMOIP_002535 [Candidatus Nitrosomirales archaeon]|jgi:hypothetical protein